MTTSKSKSILIAGGGTGGHVLAGVAVADAWRVHWGIDAPVLFVGAKGGIEEKLIARTPYPLKTLQLGSLNKVGWSRKLKTVFQLPLALFNSGLILWRFRPKYILGVGGYSSGPMVLVARVFQKIGLLKCRIGILEQNVVPGMTNRILSDLVDLIFAAFPGTDSAFPNKQVVLTGNPIRSVMKRFAPASREPFTVFVFGGSQGALGINSLVLAALPFLEDLKANLRFVHQTGEKDFERVRQGYQQAATESQVEKFIYDMPTVYAQASLLICRAGSSSLSEVAAVGRAALLIPLPTAADNHQEKNARVFADSGAARLLLQPETRGEDLARLIRELYNNPSELRRMEEKVTQFFLPNAAADLVKSLAQ